MFIHPNLLSTINEIFKSTLDKINEFKTLIEQYADYTKNSTTRVMVVDGTVIEPPHIQRMKSFVGKFEGR